MQSASGHKSYSFKKCYKIYLALYLYFYFHDQLEISLRSVEQGTCPTATLYSLAAAYKGGRCKQGAIIFHGAEL